MLFVTEMWERFSYYGMRALLIMYLATEVARGGLGYDKSTASMIYGVFCGLVYFTPIIGGYIADTYLAPLVCGFLAENMFATKEAGEIIHYGFLAARIGMVLGQIIFTFTYKKFIGDIGQAPERKKDKNNSNIEKTPLTKQEKNRTMAIIILTIVVIFFWAGFEQAGSSLTIYTKDFIDRNVGGYEVPVSWFQSLNPVFIVLLAPIVSKIWITLSKRPKGDLSIPIKMSLGMILLGLGFVLMVGAALQRGAAGDDVAVKANIMWLIGAYFLHTVGELCLSPIGLSMVSKLAPVKITSLLMGVWLLSSFVANIIGGFIASNLESLGHIEIFGGIAVVSIALGFILIVINKKLIKMME